jgi:hypothetical protein
MRHGDYLTTAAVETERFAAAAAALPPDARVPTGKTARRRSATRNANFALAANPGCNPRNPEYKPPKEA